MNHIFKRTVVLLNSLDKIDVLLQRAIAFSTTHQTTLEILYVHETPLFSVPDIFLQEEQRKVDELDREKVKEKILDHLDALSYREESVVLVYIDDTVDRLLNHAKESRETLVVVNYHEHITAELIEQCHYTFWINKSSKESYQKMIMPIDLKDEAQRCIKTIQHIFPESSLELVYDYRYLLDLLVEREDYLNVVPISTSVDYALNQELKAKNREQFEAYKKEFNIDGYFMEGSGDLHEDLIEYIGKQSFDLTLLYYNDEVLFFSPTLILALLKGLSTDFFICQCVPK
jgi:hypothetical protein